VSDAGKICLGRRRPSLRYGGAVLVTETTKVTEMTAIQAYMHAYGVPGMLVWPVACFEYAAGLCLFLGYRARPVAILLAGWCLLTALIFHRQFSDLDQLMNFFKKPDDGRRISMAGQG
jgi:uncharacterized membrane protein YphA (DoxX/SURF4 family)